jgi:hypothetical protein
MFKNMTPEFNFYEPLPYNNNSHQPLSQGLDEARFVLEQSFGQELQQCQVEKCPPVYPTPHVSPTPLASQGVIVVDEVTLKEASWFKDQVFVRESLRPFLRSLQFEDLNNSIQQHVCIVSQSQMIDEMMQHTAVGFSQDMIEEMSKSSSESNSTKIRRYQSEQWDERFEELVQFNNEHGHCLVPITWEPNVALGLWVKRQRYQYQLKNKEKKHSTLTDWRQEALEKLDFVWESRGIAWEEKYAELVAFHEAHGHCTIAHYIPKTKPLSVWVKCQRRQFKLFSDNRKSSITPNRVIRLNRLGFNWFPRRKVAMNDNEL